MSRKSRLPLATELPVRLMPETPDRVECPECATPMLGSVIVTREVLHNKHLNQYTVEREAYCDHCEHIIHWTEALKHGGDCLYLTGKAMNFKISRNQERVFKFRREHRYETGVIQR